MTFSRRMILSLAGGFLTAFAGTTAFAADTTVHVSLSDKGPDSAMMDPTRMYGMGKGMMSDMSMAMLGITIDKAEVPAGMVTFEVSNDSKDLIHEMVLSPIASREVEMPYLAEENKIDEDKDGHLGEVAELDPGKSGTLAVELKPGLYLLYCNIAGHYIGGMWTVLTVTE